MGEPITANGLTLEENQTEPIQKFPLSVPENLFVWFFCCKALFWNIKASSSNQLTSWPYVGKMLFSRCLCWSTQLTKAGWDWLSIGQPRSTSANWADRYNWLFLSLLPLLGQLVSWFRNIPLDWLKDGSASGEFRLRRVEGERRIPELARWFFFTN